MGKCIVRADPDLKELIPGYLKNRNDELPGLYALLAAGDMDGLRKAGHRLAGSGGGYGFEMLTELGKMLEKSAADKDAAGAAAQLAAVKEYLDNVEVIYE
jgi:HPt (histidine-containing phosphotransfer) domain-containing protein